MASTVREAIEQRLKTTPALSTLLSSANSVYHRRAPQASRPPMVVFDKRAGVPSYCMGGDSSPILNETWLIRGVAFGRSAGRAEEIAEAIDSAMTDAPLTLNGRTLLAVYKDSDVDYPEQVGKELFQHAGGIYRIFSQG